MKKRSPVERGGISGVVLIFSIFLLMSTGCGGTDGSETSEENSESPHIGAQNISLSDLVGTYGLSGFSETDIRNGSVTDQSTAANWWGQMVISDDGVIQFRMTRDNENYGHTWQVISLESDALQLSEEGCIDWVDVQREDNLLTLIWPEGECSENIIRTWRFYKISGSSDSSPPSENPNANPDFALADLTGTYRLTGFSMTNTTDGFTIDQSDSSNWSGEMVVTTEGMMDFTLTADNDSYYFLWEILAVGTDWLQLREGNCTQWVYVIFTENRFTVTWPEGECLEEISATYHFQKISDEATVSLQSKDAGRQPPHLFTGFTPREFFAARRRRMP